MRTHGAHSCVRSTPTGLPDWTSSVSSSPSTRSSRTIASKASHDRTARPVPPYTTRWSGSSATSGSRLFMSIRRAASWAQPRQVNSGPRGARTGRGPEPDMADRLLRQPGHHALAEAALAERLDGDQEVVPGRIGDVDVVGPDPAGARRDERVVPGDVRLGMPLDPTRLIAHGGIEAVAPGSVEVLVEDAGKQPHHGGHGIVRVL